MKKAEITIEQAREWYKGHPAVDEFILTLFSKEELEGSDGLTKLWSEIEWINGWYIRDSVFHPCENGHTIRFENKEVFATESQARSALAFAQLSQVAKEANNRAGWQPDWKDTNQDKWIISREIDKLYMCKAFLDFHHITFHSREAAEESLQKHNDLWKQYWEL